jgi:quinol monooxygenase YgiN
MIHVLALITAHPGKRGELLDAIRANTETVLAEEGCIEYRAAVDAADPTPAWSALGPGTLAIIEKWESRAALRKHASAPHMLAYAAAVKDIVAQRFIHVLEPAPDS